MSFDDTIIMNPRILASILTGIWAIAPSKADGYLPLIASILKNEHVPNELDIDLEKKANAPYLIDAKGIVHHISDYGQLSSPEQAPKGSTAIMPILGAITKYDQYCGPSGTNTKTDIYNRCLANPNIESIIFAMDSPGGESVAPERLEKAILAGNKPTLAFGDGMIGSAAYRIAAACDEIYLSSKIDIAGSIGTYLSFMDFRGYFEKEGVKIHEIYSDKATEKNLPFREALKGNYGLIKKEINFINDLFIASVKANRGDKLTDQDKVFKGGHFFAEQAQSLGLIDGIKPLPSVIERASELVDLRSINNSTTSKKSYYVI